MNETCIPNNFAGVVSCWNPWNRSCWMLDAGQESICHLTSFAVRSQVCMLVKTANQKSIYTYP